MTKKAHRSADGNPLSPSTIVFDCHYVLAAPAFGDATRGALRAGRPIAVELARAFLRLCDRSQQPDERAF